MKNPKKTKDELENKIETVKCSFGGDFISDVESNVSDEEIVIEPESSGKSIKLYESKIKKEMMES